MPAPPVDGGAKVLYNHAIGLLEAGHTVKILAVNSMRNFILPESVPEKFSEMVSFECVLVDTRIKLLHVIANLFSNESYNVKRFISRKFEEKLSVILQRQKFDIIQLETIFMAPYVPVIRKYSDAKIIIRSQNVEYKIWESLGKNQKNILKRKYFQLLSKRLKKYENKAMGNSDGVIAITENDKHTFVNDGLEKPVIAIPLGFDFKNRPEDTVISPPVNSIYHLASMNWLPNVEAVNWFLDHVWKNLIREIPDLKFFLAGRHMQEKYFEIKSTNLIVEGEILHPAEYLKDKQIMIVPLLSGSGIRAKIIEAMSFGKTVISTSRGAEGIHYSAEKNILIADTPLEFINQIKKCVVNPEFCRSIGRNAKQLMEKEYDNDLLVGRSVKFYDSLLRDKE